MKNLLIVIAVIGISLSTQAQRGFIKGPRVITIVRPSFGYYNPAFGFGYSPFGYSPYGYRPNYNNGNRNINRTSKIDLTIEQIKNDYRHDIANTRNDKSLAKSDRRQKIRDMKHNRDNAIIEAKKEYYYKKK